MKTIATLAVINVGQKNYEVDRLLCLQEGMANKLINLGLVTESPYGIDAAIASRKAYIMGLWQPDAQKADIEARVVLYPVIVSEIYKHNPDLGNAEFPVRSI